MIYLSNDPYPQEISIPRSFGVIVPQRKVYLTEDDIAANLETDSDRKVLAASQGFALKRMVDDKADKDDTYTKQQTDDLLAEKANLTDIPDVSQFITRSVNDLANYYLKSETYTQQEVRDLIAAINQFHYEVYASLSDVTDPQSNVLYLIGPTGTGGDKYEEYVFTTEWVKIGDTSIDLSGYVTTQALNTALADYVTNSALETALAGKADADEVYTKQETDTALDGKADKQGEFPDMLVGTAESLLGTGSQVSDFVFSPMPGADGIAKLNAARGKSLVWNQLVQNGNFADGNTGWNSNLVVVNNEATRTLASGGANMQFYTHASKISNHKYYIRCSFKCSNVSGITMFRHIWYGGSNLSTTLTNRLPSENNKWNDISFIVTGNVDGDNGEFNFYFNMGSNAAEGDTITARNIFCVDLTLMFGAGNEPSSVAEFEAMFPLPYYDYNQGRIISNKTESVKVTGFNQWDEEWELGEIRSSDGENANNTTTWRSVGFVPVLPETEYFAFVPLSGTPSIRARFYNANKEYIGYNSYSGTQVSANTIFKTPTNAHYIRFAPTISAIPTGTKLCINLSDPVRNGEYQPYKTNTIQLNLPTLTGKLNGEGESVVVFPDGLKSAGSVNDEIVGNKAIKRVGVVDMGTLTWYLVVSNNVQLFRANVSTAKGETMCISSKYAYFYASNGTSFRNNAPDKSIALCGWNQPNDLVVKDSAYTDAASFKTAMSGVLLYYELATPEEYILDEPLPGTFRGYKGGTIKQIPENTATPATAPMVMDATYPADMAAGTADSITAMLNAMKAAGIFSSYTMTYNPATGNYQFTFTR